ncbi:MAG: ATP-binding cassette domain-containing protein [Deltaproteobacteria bacterium]|nr:ATP-binding cassette domain-containing protein [Deltaproteobacteria bacterium]
MALEVSLKKRLTSFELDLSFTVSEGALKVIIGPSGAGKSTIIRLIAGLERPDHGTIAYNGETWVDTEQGIFLPTQKRRVGFVFQDYTLFPHLSVYRNVAFSAQDTGEIERLLKLFGIFHLKDRMPQNISGGERQRCAICQNLARKPKVLLLDEPFSALDTENRRKLRRELKDLKEELSIPIIHVTHDLNEALVLGDDILSIVLGKMAPDWFQHQLKEAWKDEFPRNTVFNKTF